MPLSAAPNRKADAEALETATDQTIAACGGVARDTVKALLVANEFLEAEVEGLQAAVSKGHARAATGTEGSKPVPAEQERAMAKVTYFVAFRRAAFCRQ
jgi:hypothetical protein